MRRGWRDRYFWLVVNANLPAGWRGDEAFLQGCQAAELDEPAKNPYKQPKKRAAWERGRAARREQMARLGVTPEQLAELRGVAHERQG